MNFKHYLLFSFTFFMTLGITAQDVSFEEYNPKSTLVVPGDSIFKAKFPFIDVHGHQYRMPTQDLSPVVADMDKLNLRIMVNLSGRTGDDLVKSVKNIATNFPGRFVVFANINFEGAGSDGWTEKMVAQLEQDVKNGARGLKVYKSLGLRNKDAQGNRLAINDPRLDAIWAKCGELGIPVLIHSADPASFWDEFDGDNERWLELKTHPRRKRSDTNPAPFQQIMDEQYSIIKKHKNTKFISAHMTDEAAGVASLVNLIWRFFEDFPDSF